MKKPPTRLPGPGDYLDPSAPNPLASAAADVTELALSGFTPSQRPMGSGSLAAAPLFDPKKIPPAAHFKMFAPRAASVPFGLGVLPFGVYLVIGGADSGKSINCCALYFWLWATGTSARYLPIAEPRSPEKSLLRNDDLGALLETVKSSPALLNGTTGSHYEFVALDSVGLAMRMYDPHGNRGKFGVMAQGMSPLDQQFIRDFQLWARHKCALFLVVNDQEVPFAAELEPLSEGICVAQGAGALTVKFRSGLRRALEVTIPPAYVSAAGLALGYDEVLASASPALVSAGASTTLLR